MKNKFIIVWVFYGWIGGPPVLASFPYDINSGFQKMEGVTYKTILLAGGMGIEPLFNSQVRLELDYFKIQASAFKSFLESNPPRASQIAIHSKANQKYVTSSEREMNLAWNPSNSGVPVRYKVYWGAHPWELHLAIETDELQFKLTGLNFHTEYFWRIEAIDIFGRSTMGPLYSFSITPGVGKFYCAPNPFRAGTESTAFVFSMPGQGSARLDIYALPHYEKVFSQNYEGLQDDNNLIEYRGTDNNGRVLFNGLYLAVIEKKGSRGQSNEKFRFLVVK